MVVDMKENLLMENVEITVFKLGKMEINILDNDKRGKCTEKEYILGQMEKNMKDNSKKMRNTAVEL